MRKLKLTLAGISTSFVLTALMMCFSTSAFAAGIGADVQAGTTVTATASDANISPFTLNGHTRNATYDLPITVVDSRGDASSRKDLQRGCWLWYGDNDGHTDSSYRHSWFCLCR